MVRPGSRSFTRIIVINRAKKLRSREESFTVGEFVLLLPWSLKFKYTQASEKKTNSRLR